MHKEILMVNFSFQFFFHEMNPLNWFFFNSIFDRRFGMKYVFICMCRFVKRYPIKIPCHIGCYPMPWMFIHNSILWSINVIFDGKLKFLLPFYITYLFTTTLMRIQSNYIKKCSHFVLSWWFCVRVCECSLSPGP